MQGPTYLNQDEAAVVCGKSKDTIRRYRRGGRLANSRQRLDGTVEIAVSDLVAAGLLDPLAAAGDVAEVATRSRVERDLVTSRQELEVMRTQNQGLQERFEHAKAEIEFLRSLLRQTAVA
jgi:hypothetical protein